MTDLLKELEVVVANIETAESWDCTGDQMRCLDGTGCECAMRGHDRPDAEGDAVNFISTHHAEIAEAMKDAQRLDFVERCVHALDWDGDGMKIVIVADDGSEHKADTYRQAIDAAIDAMHNSAQTVGITLPVLRQEKAFHPI